MEWRYFTEVAVEVAEGAKNLTKKLEGETGKIEQIYKSYWALLEEERATPKEWEDMNKLTKCLNEIQGELRNIQEKAVSKEILIKFAGATSSGKSSLINALLRSRRLPVGFMQTTMCSFKVCTTKEKEWSVTVKGENDETVCLASSENEKYVRDLLSKMSGKKHADDREKMKIDTRTVVQVNWPQHLCEVLPLNVVLFDTPGLAENFETDEVVTESCRKADIIVAVMDAMSQSKATVARLVNNVNCQFTFGVFTKWDECKRKEKEKKSEDTVDVDQLREHSKQDFQNALKGECEVFFVNVECENTNDEAFKKFERKLQASATKLKGESVIKQAKSVNEKSIAVAGKLKDIVDAKEKQKAASIDEEKDSMNKDKESFNNLKRILKRTEELTRDAYNENTKRIEDFEKEVREGKPEDVAHAGFIEKVDEYTRDTLIKQRNQIQSAFKIWAENNNNYCDLDVNEFLSNIDGIKCEKQGLSEEEYNWMRDPNWYVTNDYISAAVLLGGFAGVAIAGVAGLAGLAGVIAAESLPAVAGTTALGSVAAGTGGLGGALAGLFRVGRLVQRIYPVSEYKLRCWRQKLRGDLKKLYTCCKDLIFNDIARIKKKASEKLGHAEAEKEKKIREEERKVHNLTIWASESLESHTRLTERNREFDELLTELSYRLSKAEQESRPQQIDAAEW